MTDRVEPYFCVNCDTAVAGTAESIARHVRACKSQKCPYCRRVISKGGTPAVLLHMRKCAENPSRKVRS